MKKVAPKTKQVFRQAWSKYQDTLWRMEKAWNDQSLDYNQRQTLTNSVLEMIKIEKRLKSIEYKYLGRVGE